jgi:hypothetical protein
METMALEWTDSMYIYICILIYAYITMDNGVKITATIKDGESLQIDILIHAHIHITWASSM